MEPKSVAIAKRIAGQHTGEFQEFEVGSEKLAHAVAKNLRQMGINATGRKGSVAISAKGKTRLSELEATIKKLMWFAPPEIFEEALMVLNSRERHIIRRKLGAHREVQEVVDRHDAGENFTAGGTGEGV